MRTGAIAYAFGLVGVTLDGRGTSVLVFLSVAVAAAAVRHWGGAWQRQKTRRGNESYGE